MCMGSRGELVVELIAQKGFVCLLSSWMPEFSQHQRTILITMIFV